MFTDEYLNNEADRRGSRSGNEANRANGGFKTQNPQGSDEPYGYRGGKVNASPSVLGGQDAPRAGAPYSGVYVLSPLDKSGMPAATSFINHLGRGLPGAQPQDTSGLGGSRKPC